MNSGGFLVSATFFPFDRLEIRRTISERISGTFLS